MTAFTDPREDNANKFLEFLSTHGVHLRNPTELREKLLQIMQDGPSQFQVVSDFDRTITPQWLKDPCSQTGCLKACHSSHGVIEASPFVTPEYAKHTRELADHYIPLEHDIRLTNAHKAVICDEWYHKAHTCMLEEKLSRTMLDKIVEHCWSTMEIHLRLNTNVLFSVCSNSAIPVTVLSAGLADVIERILAMEDITTPLVVGNRMTFNANRDHIGFSEPVIHALNKKHALTCSLNSDEIRSSRPNALVMGDLIADVEFVHSIPHLSKYIAIGFLADGPDHEARLTEYLKHFDIVMVGGGASMDVAVQLVNCLFA